MQSITIKQGSSFSFTGNATNDGSPVDLTGFTLKSQVRDREGTFVDTLGIVINNAVAGSFTITATTGTLAYPIGTLELDIRLTHAPLVEFSETILLNVIPSITR